MKEAHLVKADEKIKPIIYKIWRLNKTRIDIPDHRMGSYTTKSKKKKLDLSCKVLFT